MELISACRRPANDLIKVLKTMISVAAVKQYQPVPQQVDESDAGAAGSTAVPVDQVDGAERGHAGRAHR
jgi:hypothetical protein